MVGVVDLEWSYAGPAQLFGSAPWWLLQDRLNNYDTFLDKEEAPRVLGRYLRNLDVFKTVLEEEEARMPGRQAMELSRLVRHSEESGSMWLHMLLSWGLNHPDSLPFTQLQARLGPERWKELEEGHHGKEARFTERKLAELDKYDEMVERMECLQDDVENGKMTIEAFVERVWKSLIYYFMAFGFLPSLTLSPGRNSKTTADKRMHSQSRYQHVCNLFAGQI